MVRDLLVILVDALGFKLTNNNKNAMPFLFESIGQGPYRLRTLLGYSMGIQMSIWSGVGQNVHNRWSEYEYSRRRNVSRFNAVSAILPEARFANFLRSGLTYASSHLLGETDLLPGLPPKLIPMFDKREYYQPGSRCHVNTFFDILTMNQQKYLYWHLHEPDFGKVRKFESPDYHVKVIFIDYIDHKGHHHELDSLEMRRSLSQLDAFIEEVARNWRRSRPTGDIVIFSDHGLTRIEKRVDVRRQISRLGYDLGPDYIAFLDSTMVRFWFRDSEAKARILSHLSHSKDGRLLSEADLSKYKIDFADNQTLFGESIFLVNPGAYVFPNYFHCVLPNFIRTMHGYDPEDPNSDGVFMYDGPHHLVSRSSVDIVDLFPTMLNLAGLPVPHTCEGISLVRGCAYGA
jgi:predicted AlkP superfamily pyrophosphatase or phosphodiesterase